MKNLIFLGGYSQWAKSSKKQSEGVRFCIRHSIYSAILSKINTLLQTAFSAIFPTGLAQNKHSRQVAMSNDTLWGKHNFF